MSIDEERKQLEYYNHANMLDNNTISISTAMHNHVITLIIKWMP